MKLFPRNFAILYIFDWLYVLLESQFRRCISITFNLSPGDDEFSALVKTYGKGCKKAGHVNYRKFLKDVEAGIILLLYSCLITRYHVIVPAFLYVIQSHLVCDISCDDINHFTFNAGALSFTPAPSCGPSSDLVSNSHLDNLARFCAIRGVNVGNFFEDYDYHKKGLVTEAQVPICLSLSVIQKISKI